MTVKELLGRSTSRELTEWAAFFSVEAKEPEKSPDELSKLIGAQMAMMPKTKRKAKQEGEL